MVSLITRFTLALAVVASTQAARLPHRGRSHGNMRPSAVVPIVELKNTDTRVDKNGATLPPLNTTYEFDQLIDHNHPELGTFKQRFWTTWEFYESGGPIVLFTPGEANAARESAFCCLAVLVMMYIHVLKLPTVLLSIYRIPHQ